MVECAMNVRRIPVGTHMTGSPVHSEAYRLVTFVRRMPPANVCCSVAGRPTASGTSNTAPSDWVRWTSACSESRMPSANE